MSLQTQDKSSYLAVHVVLSLDQLAPVNLPVVGFTGDYVSLCFMKNFDGHSNRHLNKLSVNFKREK